MQQPLILNSRAQLTGHLKTTLSLTIQNHTTWFFEGPGFHATMTVEFSSIKRVFDIKVL